ncbi:hypothetical protein IEC97_15875 [Neobacillus cucumis]|uniref:hypothetical protein n=1 Tax=Neobacillus cucumis TaxID=1740721 RepID=UPI0018DFE966|nr:hypothetical protein [Neobacillus cucumis]MBI0578844.1 hypothetical protein [Neobacillus cucumis]WHY92639.1 hypothetical protein QNK12_03770 [Neobacillus cucumis]
MKPFKEKKKHKKKIRHYVFEEILECIFEGILGLIWRLIVGFFHLLARSIAAVFHHFF